MTSPHDPLRLPDRYHPARLIFCLLPAAGATAVVLAGGFLLTPIFGTGPVIICGIIAIAAALIPALWWFNKTDLELDAMNHELDRIGFRQVPIGELTPEEAAISCPGDEPFEPIIRALARDGTPNARIAWIRGIRQSQGYRYSPTATIAVECENELPLLMLERIARSEESGPRAEARRPADDWTVSWHQTADHEGEALLRSLGASEAFLGHLRYAGPCIQRIETRGRWIRIVLTGWPRGPVLLAAVRAALTMAAAARRA